MAMRASSMLAMQQILMRVVTTNSGLRQHALDGGVIRESAIDKQGGRHIIASIIETVFTL
jgi:hypothetical protein